MLQWLVKKMIYPAPPVSVSDPPPDMKEMRFTLSTGETVIGWLSHQSSLEDSIPVVLYFHGNGENLETMRQSGIFEDFRRLGAHFLAMDYPGYGRSTGQPSEHNLIESADSAFAWILQNYPKYPKFIAGWSLGAAVAIQAAAQYHQELSGLIAMSAWSSLPDVAATHYPDFLVDWAVEENYNSVAAARQIQCPVLMIHGAVDQIIPLSQGEQVAANMASSPRFIKVSGAGHNDLLSRAVVWEEMKGFIYR